MSRIYFFICDSQFASFAEAGMFLDKGMKKA